MSSPPALAIDVESPILSQQKDPVRWDGAFAPWCHPRSASRTRANDPPVLSNRLFRARSGAHPLGPGPSLSDGIFRIARGRPSPHHAREPSTRWAPLSPAGERVLLPVFAYARV